MKLYALSRVSDYLIETIYQAGELPAGLEHPSLPRAVETGGQALEAPALYREFFCDLGLTPFDQTGTFSPFHHEIVAVLTDPSATAVTVEEILWPGFMFGDLLFSRAGTKVRAPQHLVDATVAATSTLYFTHRREPRPTADLADGWGSNSQWRTAFPRFYADQEGLHFNWDGDVDIGDDPPGPREDGRDDDPVDQRREVLLNRCFVRDSPPDDCDDRFPYADRISVTNGAWPLRPEFIVHVDRGR
jgi:hypothetical protein